MKAYSQDLRDRAIDLYKHEEYSRHEISNLLKISYQTICEWIKRYKITGDYSSRQHLVKGRKCQFSDKQAVLEYLKHHSDADGIEIRDALIPSLPMSTFYDAMNRMEITYKKKSLNTNKGQRKKDQITLKS